MQRVVVTGLGAVSPCGNDVNSTWESLIQGRSGIGPITHFDATDWPVRIAGEVKDFDPSVRVGPKADRRMDLFSMYAVAAAREAVRDAGLDGDQPLGERAGVYVGSGIGGIREIAHKALIFDDKGARGLSPFFIPKSLTNLAGGHVAIEHGASGPSLCISTACATGNHSIGEAWRVIRSGDADVVIAGGAEGAVDGLGLAGFMRMRALSKRNDDPETASRPFDRDRDGFVMGEGAGIVVVESLAHAQARGARIYAELVGYGLTNDAHHITSPPAGHAGAVRCMQMALRSAGMSPEDVDYINAHGTSTPANDSAECQAIRTVFGDQADRLMVSSTKSVTGHLLGAAGGVEAVAAAKSLHHQLVPPTATLQTPGEGCDLDFVPGEARAASVRAVLSNSFGFGGTNATLIFSRFRD
jgi:3-oxoacyl-[acyl-carrier-protein] synthase II